MPEQSGRTRGHHRHTHNRLSRLFARLIAAINKDYDNTWHIPLIGRRHR